MSSILGFESTPVPAGDARALQLRLYREIGVSAVAEALTQDFAYSAEVVVLEERAAVTLAREAA